MFLGNRVSPALNRVPTERVFSRANSQGAHVTRSHSPVPCQPDSPIRAPHPPGHYDWLGDEHVTQSERSLGLFLARSGTEAPPQVDREIRVRAWSCGYYSATVTGSSLGTRARTEAHREDREKRLHPELSVSHQQLTSTKT